jgi:tetratricopeptide (TPR) repeat protein
MPQQISAQTQKGIELYNSWNYQEAEKVLSDTLKTQPQDMQAHFYLGLSILSQEKYKEALDLFMKVKDANAKAGKKTEPDEFQVEIALTRAHLGLKQYAEAWKNLELAGKGHENNPDLHVYRGAYYLQQDKIANALKELDKAISLDKDNPYAHYYAGHAYIHDGNPARAVEELKLFLQLAPMAPEAVKAKALVDALC